MVKNKKIILTKITPKMDREEAYKVAYKSGFHCHTVERLTDSIKTIISPVYESFKPRFIVTKRVPK